MADQAGHAEHEHEGHRAAAGRPVPVEGVDGGQQQRGETKATRDGNDDDAEPRIASKTTIAAARMTSSRHDHAAARRTRGVTDSWSVSGT